MGTKEKKKRFVNSEIDAITWAARKAGLSYGHYVNETGDKEKRRAIREFKIAKNIEDAEE